MTDAFAEAIGRVILGATGLEESLRQNPADAGVEWVRAQLIGLIDGFSQSVRNAPGREEDYDLARCALVCWLDEVFTVHCDWPLRQPFRARCLELHYRDIQGLRGRRLPEVRRPVEGPTLFYEMADVARQRPGSDAIEVFYLCVNLGFQGELYEDAERKNWVESTYRHIQERQAADPTPVPTPAGDLGPLRGGRFRLVVAILVAATALVTLVAFILAVHLRPY